MSVYVFRAVHVWQTELAAAQGDSAHDAGSCGICHFVLAPGVEPGCVTMPLPPQAYVAVLAVRPPSVATVAVGCCEGRGPPVFVA